MPAAIDTTNGVANAAFFREPAWHQLGEVFTETVTDYRVMLEKANLNDWDVRLVPLASTVGARHDKETFEVVRTNPTDGGIDRLGVSGERYTVVQNEQIFEFASNLAKGQRWETAGAIKGGSTVFGTIAIESEIVLDPTGVADKVKKHLLISGSFDGSSAITGGGTAVRVVCGNTLDMALGNLSNQFKFRHTLNVEKRMAAWVKLQETAAVWFDAFEKEAKELYSQAATDKEFFSIVESLFPKPENDVKGAIKKWESKQEIFSQAYKQEANAGIRGTRWGILNALTEGNQWGRKVYSGNTENFYAAGAGFDNPTQAFRQKALTLVKAL